MKEVVTPVSVVLTWLPRVPPETAAEMLVGCGFHDGQSGSMDVTIIEAIDVGRVTLTLAGAGRPVSLRKFRDGEFIECRSKIMLSPVSCL